MSRTDELRRGGARPRTDGPSMTAGGAREVLTTTLDEDPFRRIEELRDAGRRKAEAEGNAYRLERGRKSLIARLASEYQKKAKGQLSEAKAERLARADERYQKHINGTAAAIEEKELAQSEYWAQRTRLEWLRAAVAHENTLARLEEPA